MIFKDLEPKNVFQNFKEISNIPRCSLEEKQISDYLVQWANERNLEVIQDEWWNVIIKKSGSPGREDEEPVILQGHMDMVCEKRPESDHDFSKDPILWDIKEDWIYAKDTTLGADNGIAVAMIMAVLESEDISHPPLEALITSDEESGMTGALKVNPKLFKSKRLINLDSEEEGVACVACAGGENDYVLFKKDIIKRRYPKTYELKISGLKGGHSGMDIHKGLGNANKLLGRALYRFSKEFSFELLHIEGGAKPNAIPRDATAYIGVKEEDIKEMQRLVVILGGEFTKEFAFSDPRVKLSFEEMVDDGRLAFTDESRDAFISYLMLVPNGVQSYSQKMNGLVETSTNIGVIEDNKDEVVFTSALRSSVESHIEYMSNIHEVLARSLGGRFEGKGRYPSWEFRHKSPLRDVAVKSYKEYANEELQLESIHAGLECALFDQRFQDLDMISIGPNIKGAHSPDERLSISSTKKVYEFFIKILENI
ncbi:MAG: aminoacyl-histidine dipeptidase [Tissierellia bacterium]|nr:aminoacyl-histidine dipeptidase [Tissierellia bacterium]